jgi:hypothetical protein
MPHAHFDALPEVLKEVRTRPLFVMRLKVQPPVVVGNAAGVNRRIGLVYGGSFKGARLSGEVLDGGSDWQAVRADGSTTLDVRLVLKTKDEATIAMTYRGVRHGPPDIIKQLERGGDINPASYYYRISPMFETAGVPYDWLNRTLAVGIGHRQPDGPVYSVFEML